MQRASHRRWPRLVVAVLVVAVVLVIAGYVVVRARTGNISHPNVHFVSEPPPPVPPKPKPHAAFVWPTYGYTPERTRVIGALLHPPFDTNWSKPIDALLEFPPVIYGHSLYLLDDDATLHDISTDTGHSFWFRRLGKQSAASPAVDAKAVYAPILTGTHGGGQIWALDRGSGRVLWSHDLASRSESSPLVINGSVYFGAQDGSVYAFNARTGARQWVFHAEDAVKGGLAFSDGVLYIGDYSGHMYALRPGDGSVVWKVGTSGARFGFGSGNFYSTPAVAFGRVYAGNTDGRVYSFAQDSGKLAWASQTGNYVYGSPAVENTPGIGPTAFVGSYDGTFYAFDARSGHVRWQYDAGGKISGSPTIVDGVVYFSNLAARSTIGLSVRDGHRVYSFPDGGFNPIVTDGTQLYLNGYTTLYALQPPPPPPPPRRPAPGPPRPGPRPGAAPAAQRVH